MEGTSTQPLKGVGVLVTRAEDQAAGLVSELESLGARVYAIPAIETNTLAEPEGLEEALRKIPDYDHLVFTSVNGVNIFRKHLDTAGLSPVYLPSALCVGPRTAEAWRDAGGTVGLVPESYSARGIIEALGKDLSGMRLLVLRPEHVKTELGALLRERGSRVDEIVLYRTVVGDENAGQLNDLLNRGILSAVMFASPSALEGILSMTQDHERLNDILAVCIGPVTARAAVEGGFKRVIYPVDYTVDGMVKLLVDAAAEMRYRR